MGERVPLGKSFARALVRAGRRDRPPAGARDRAFERGAVVDTPRSRTGLGSSHVCAAVSLAAIAFVLVVGTPASAADGRSAGGGVAGHPATWVVGSAGGPPAATRGDP